MTKYIRFGKFVRIIEFNYELFPILFIMFLLLVMAKTIWNMNIYVYINIDYVLIIVILSGMISILARKEEYKKIGKKDIKLAERHYIYIEIIGMYGMLIIWYKIKYIGNIAYLISIISGILIILLSLLILDDNENNI